jgi:hypothetical protein
MISEAPTERRSPNHGSMDIENIFKTYGSIGRSEREHEFVSRTSIDRVEVIAQRLAANGYPILQDGDGLA